MTFRRLLPILLLTGCAGNPGRPSPVLESPPPRPTDLPCRTRVDGFDRFYVRDEAGRLAFAFTDVAGVPARIDAFEYPDEGGTVVRTHVAPTGEIEITRAPHDGRALDLFEGVIQGDHPSFDCAEAPPAFVESGAVGPLEGGLRQGTWTVKLLGLKLREVQYSKGWPVRATTFYPSGERYEEGAFEQGLRTGVWRRYWENGKVREEGGYVLGNREGDFAQFDPAGNALPSLRFEEGEPVCSPLAEWEGLEGERLLRTPDGQVCPELGTVQLAGGQLRGRVLRMQERESIARQTSQVIFEGQIEDGNLHGAVSRWTRIGALDGTDLYWFGEFYAKPLHVDWQQRFIARSREQKPIPPRIGLQFASRSAGEAGLVVHSVVPGFPAKAAGLAPGDAVKKINGVELHAFSEVSALVAQGEVHLEVTRGAEHLIFDLTPLKPPPYEGPWADAPCPGAIARNPAAYYLAGREILTGIRYDRKDDSAPLRERAMACFRAAFDAPREQRPSRVCGEMVSLLLDQKKVAEAHEQAWACVVDAKDPALAAEAWSAWGAGTRGGSLVAYLLDPSKKRWIDVETGKGTPAEGLESVGRRKLTTGRVELPELVAERRRSTDGDQEWLWLLESGEPEAQSWATILPVGSRIPGECAAGRELEIVEGRVRITSTTVPDRRGRVCEARVAPVGEYPLSLFLARPLSHFSSRRKLPPKIETVWRNQRSEKQVDDVYSLAAVDLNLDGELDWLIRGVAIDIIGGGEHFSWLGRIEKQEGYGLEVKVLPDAYSYYRGLVLLPEAGSSAPTIRFSHPLYGE